MLSTGAHKTVAELHRGSADEAGFIADDRISLFSVAGLWKNIEAVATLIRLRYLAVREFHDLRVFIVERG